MLMGSSDNRIDSKGRLVMPAKFRSQIGETVVCTVGLDNCLAVYPMDAWNAYLQKLQDQVVVNGVNDHLEIWNSAKWAASNDEMLDNFTALAEGVADLGI